MAKKKRLNKRVVILLATLGVVVALLVITALILSRPEDPVWNAERGAEALRKGEFREAIRYYGIAARAAPEPDKPKYLLSLANAKLTFREKGASLSQAERMNLFGGSYDDLLEALRYDPRNIAAQRRLTELDFMIARGRHDWERYISSADKLLEMEEDENVLFQRAMAKARLAETRSAYVERALADYKRLIELAPEEEKYRLGLVQFMGRFKEAEEIEEALKKAREACKQSVKIRVAYAEFLSRHDRKPEALAVLQEAIAVQPKDVDGYLGLALYHQREKEIDKALTTLQRGAEADPSDYRTYAMIARIYGFRKAWPEAEKALTQGLEKLGQASQTQPAEQDLTRLHGGVLLLNHQLCDILLNRVSAGAKAEDLVPRVEEALARMRAVNQDSPYVFKIEGHLKLIAGDRVGAMTLLRKAWQGFRTVDITTAELLVNVYRQLKQPGEAQKILEGLLRVSRDNPQALMALLRLYIDYRQYDQADRHLQNLLKLAPENEQVKMLKAGLDAVQGRSDAIPAEVKRLDAQTARMFMERSGQLWRENKRIPAMQIPADILQRHPRDLGALLQLIRYHRASGRNDLVPKLVEQGMEVFKDNAQVREQLSLLLETDVEKVLAMQLALVAKESDPAKRALKTAAVYRQFKKDKQYVAALTEAEKLDPGNRAAIGQLFEYFLAKKDWASAEAYAAKAGQADLDTVGGKIYQARVARARGKLADAIRLTREALRSRPVFSQGHAFLGECHLASKQVDRARESFEKAYDQNPANVSALLGMVRVCQASGKAAEFATWVQRAYKFIPNHPIIREHYLRLVAEREEPEKVIAERERIRRRQPANLMNLSQLAVLYEKVKRLKFAEARYRELVQYSKSSPEAIRMWTGFLRRTNRDAQARNILSNFVDQAKDKVEAYLIWASYLAAVGEPDQAKAVFEQAIKADPKDRRPHLNLATFSARRRHWADAADYQQKYLDKAGQDASGPARRKLVEYLILAKRFKDAHALVDKMLSDDVSDAAAWTLKGQAYLMANQYDEAKKMLDRALSVDAQRVLALVYRAQVYVARKQMSLATADLESARRLNAPPPVVLQLAGIHEQMGDFTNAHAVLQGLLTNRPDYMPALRALIDLCSRNRRLSHLQQAIAQGRKAYPNDPTFLIAEADMWSRRKQLRQAITALLAAAKLAPGDLEIGVKILEAYVQAGGYDEALRGSKDIRDNDQVGAKVMAVRGVAYAKKNQPAQAEAEFKAALAKAAPGDQLHFVFRQIRTAYQPKAMIEKIKAWVAIRPKDWEMYNLLGALLVNEEAAKPVGAVAAFEKALSYAKDDAAKYRVLRQLGVCYYQLKRMDDSLKAYQGTLAINPNDASTLNNLAWLLAYDMRKADQALPYAKRAATMRPDSPHALDTYGLVLLLKGSYTEAFGVLNRSVYIESLPSNRYHLGMVFEKTDRMESALRQYRLGWDLVKNNPKERFYKVLREACERLGDKP